MYIKALLPFCQLLILLVMTGPVTAQNDSEINRQFTGSWYVNEELSDDTDERVEEAILAAGNRLPDTGKKGRERYRGGPEEHALYDHISYDMSLEFRIDGPTINLVYDDGFERIFHTDNRKRVISASGTVAGDNRDFSFASWHNGRLIVESRVRDGGTIFETYEFLVDSSRLKVSLELKPSSFSVPVYITRVYDRVSDTD